MRKKSTYILLIIILVVFFVIMFLVFGVRNIRQGKLNTTILVGDSTIWTYKNKKWLNITSNTSIQKLNWGKYHVYLNHEEFGEYYLWHDDKWYAFNKDKDAVLLEGEMVAYQANFSIPILSFIEEEITNRDSIDYVLQDNQLPLDSEFTSSYKVVLDFDHDGIEEEFYVISNAFPSFDVDTVFSIVFMVKEDVLYYIYKDISANTSFNGCKPFFHTFLDTNLDDVYEFVLSCGRYSVSERVDMLYQFSNDEFKIVISNQ